MLIVSEMSSGKIVECSAAQHNALLATAYGEEVLHAAWVDVPRVELRLEEHIATARSEQTFDQIGFMATLYAAQE